uniref:Uncharacterized protein n=1 Tax=Rhizophora mucronata TaxID=61149 RepID=A0A2P2IZJ3_RHIMU
MLFEILTLELRYHLVSDVVDLL